MRGRGGEGGEVLIFVCLSRETIEHASSHRDRRRGGEGGGRRIVSTRGAVADERTKNKNKKETKRG